MRGAQGCVVVCDVLDENSLKSTLKWKELINSDPFFRDTVHSIEDPIPIILVQNKIDLLKEGKDLEFTKPDYLEKFAKDNKFFAGFQTSAKTSENLKNLFEVLVEEILARKITKLKRQISDLEEERRRSSSDLKLLRNGEVEEKKKCC